MTRGVSVYLDLIRFSAAFAVFARHLQWGQMTGGLFWQLAPLANAAVVVFFVLSGFVIGHSVQAPGMGARRYVVARSSRILSVAVPAVLLTFGLDAIGRGLDPGLYASWGADASGAWVPQLLAALLFVNESWAGHVQIGSNGPYWSLAYEVWYYVAFGAAVFAPRGWRAIGTAAALILAGPRIAVLFPLWLLGFAAQRACARVKLPHAAGAGLWVGTVLAAAAWLGLHGASSETAIYLHGPADLLGDYVVGAVFALNLIGAWFTPLPALATRLAPLARPIEWAANMTFTLYLVHLPVAVFLRAASPGPSASWPNRLLVAGGTLLFVVAFSYVSERRRDAWRRAIGRMLPRRPSRAGTG